MYPLYNTTGTLSALQNPLTTGSRSRSANTPRARVPFVDIGPSLLAQRRHHLAPHSFTGNGFGIVVSCDRQAGGPRTPSLPSSSQVPSNLPRFEPLIFKM